MKSICWALTLIALSVVLPPILLPFAAAAFAQDAQTAAKPESSSAKMDHSQAAAAPVAPTEAQKAFKLVKSLAGTWSGYPKLTGAMETPEDKKLEAKPIQVKMRVTSRGNALVHEMGGEQVGTDPTKYDDPVTMIYLENGQLTLTHYCDAGNRPRMTAKLSEDGKTVDFDFTDISGGDKFGHMKHARFTIVDENHHVEEWTYLMPGNKEMRGTLDLQRVSPSGAASGK